MAFGAKRCWFCRIRSYGPHRPNRQRLTVWLSDGAAEKLEEICHTERISKSEYLRGLIDIEYANWKKENP